MSIVPVAHWSASPREPEYAARLARLDTALTPDAYPVVYGGQALYATDDWTKLRRD